MEAFLKKYGLNEAEIIEFKEQVLLVDSSPLNKKGQIEKSSKLSVSPDTSKGNSIFLLIEFAWRIIFSFRTSYHLENIADIFQVIQVLMKTMTM